MHVLYRCPTFSRPVLLAAAAALTLLSFVPARAQVPQGWTVVDVPDASSIYVSPAQRAVNNPVPTLGCRNAPTEYKAARGSTRDPLMLYIGAADQAPTLDSVIALRPTDVDIG